MTLKKLSLNKKFIEYRIDIYPENIPIDPEMDRATNLAINEQLNQGNQWAWCCVKITAYIDGLEGIEGTDYLGCCSYKNEADFRSGGYFEDMQARAKEELINNFNTWIARLTKVLK
jgi:hypothetical protein